MDFNCWHPCFCGVEAMVTGNDLTCRVHSNQLQAWPLSSGRIYGTGPYASVPTQYGNWNTKYGNCTRPSAEAARAAVQQLQLEELLRYRGGSSAGAEVGVKTLQLWKK